MKVICPDSIDQSVPFDSNEVIFLAGPTPREKNVKSWRPEAIEILKEKGFNGYVYVPERSDWTVKFDYIDQVEWEQNNMNISNVIMFWVPRNMDTMPGLSSNIEFGMYISQSSIIYGRPDNAPHTRYLDYVYEKHMKCEPTNTLKATIEKVLNQLKRDNSDE